MDEAQLAPKPSVFSLDVPATPETAQAIANVVGKPVAFIDVAGEQRSTIPAPTPAIELRRRARKGWRIYLGLYRRPLRLHVGRRWIVGNPRRDTATPSC